MTHRAPETEAPPVKQGIGRFFQEKYMPHYAMLILTLIYVGMNVLLGPEGVPGTLHQGWGGTLGLWFGFLINQRAKEKE